MLAYSQLSVSLRLCWLKIRSFDVKLYFSNVSKYSKPYLLVKVASGQF